MKYDLFELYISAVKNAAVVISVIIVLLTSPAWAFIYLLWNTSKITGAIYEKTEVRKNEEKTFFDFDNVCEKIQKKSDEANDKIGTDYGNEQYWDGREDGLDLALMIVKKGWRD